jgi:glucosamine-6-phosphate deaminase
MVSKLKVQIHSSRDAMGKAASENAAQVMRDTIQRRGQVRIIVASAPSQNELIGSLVAMSGIDWSRVTIFHMDEYVGLPASHRASFRNYQEQHLLAHVQPATFYGIRGEATDPEAECTRYAALLTAAPIDLVCMGIGENGHIAFNDPPVADFNDPRVVKVVELDNACRRQQVNDGCFPNFDAVPRQAITLTCPTLMSGRVLVCVVPGSRKAESVSNTLRTQISAACPATILRLHTSATLYLDEQSAALLPSFL